MSATKLSTIREVHISIGLPEGINNPIKPERFAGVHEGRLGNAVGLTQFGVNHVTLEPGMWSALRHWHEKEDEFVYVLNGELTLVDDHGSHTMGPGAFAGFPAGETNGHHLMNLSTQEAEYIVVGSRRPGDPRHRT